MAGYDSYTRTSIQTADPRAIIVLLYEGAIRFLKQAQSALRAENRKEMSRNIIRTLNITHHLSVGLDFEAGGEIAQNLARLYDYMRDSLQEANIKCEGEKIEEVITLFKELLQGWREVAKDPQAAQALESRQAAPSPAPIEQVSREDGATEASDGTSEKPPSPEKQEYPLPPPKSKGVPEMVPRCTNSIAGRAAYGIR